MVGEEPHVYPPGGGYRYYLEMTAESEMRPSSRGPGNISLKRQVIPDPELSRHLYSAVGKDYHWTVRSNWTDEQWLERLSLDGVEMWVAYEEGAIAGYFDLSMNEERSVELISFGLLPQCIGRGIGGFLLTEAIKRAWHMGASRVWLHTSTRDHAHALANYRARGFRVSRQVVLGEESD